MIAVCRVSNGYNIVVGKEYKIVEFLPQYVTANFTFPRYVDFHDDNGKLCTAHAYRFDLLNGQSCEDYIKENIPDTIEDKS